MTIEVEIKPEPTKAERAAILVALREESAEAERIRPGSRAAESRRFADVDDDETAQTL